MILAEMPPPSSYQAVGWVLLALAAMAAAAMGIRAWIRSEAGLATPQARTIAEQPIRVTAEPKWVPEYEYQRHVQDVEARFREMDRRIASIHDDIASIRREVHCTEINLVRAGEERASKLHERINLILERVSELRGRQDATPT